MKVIAIILGIALIVGAWYLGTDWWLTLVNLRYTTRSATRLEIVAVLLVIVFATYAGYVLDRDRKSR